MDIDQWPDEIDIEDIIPAIVLGAMQSAKAERTPRSTGLSGSAGGFKEGRQSRGRSRGEGGYTDSSSRGALRVALGAFLTLLEGIVSKLSMFKHWMKFLHIIVKLAIT
jgi:hypothetical protein